MQYFPRFYICWDGMCSTARLGLPSPDSGFDITVAKAPPVFTYFSLTARRRHGGAWEGSAGTYIDAGDVYSGFRLQGKTVSCSPPEAAPSAPARRPN